MKTYQVGLTVDVPMEDVRSFLEQKIAFLEKVIEESTGHPTSVSLHSVHQQKVATFRLFLKYMVKNTVYQVTLDDLYFLQEPSNCNIESLI